jgi:hypothetical protein
MRFTRWRDEGLDAIEAYHSEHEPADVERYCALAGRLGMLVTAVRTSTASTPAASPRNRPAVLGRVSLPADAFGRLLDARPKAQR